MTYITGFHELNESDEKALLSELGVAKEKLIDGMTSPPQWAGYPRFRPQMDIWIDEYRAYAKSLGRSDLAALHRSVNRLFFSMKEGRFVSAEDHRKNSARYKCQYIIPVELNNGFEAKIWLRLAGSYTHALLLRNKELVRDEQAMLFRKSMPAVWVEVELAGYTDVVQARAYKKFVTDLGQYWSVFIDSYTNEVHGAVINNSPHAASLQTFLRGRYPDGRRLRRPSPMVYWPMPLHHYAGQDSARQLFEARKAETEALKPVCSLGAGGESSIYAFPRWLRLGVDGANPEVKPPQWMPEPSQSKPEHH